MERWTHRLMLALVQLPLFAGAAIACTPPSDHIENAEFYEDRSLERATVLFRGSIEALRQPNGRFGEVTMTIRRTRTFWGSGAPDEVAIPREYFFSCARGNLHGAVDAYGEFPGLPFVRNGLGVTVLGRPEDALSPWDYVILVDHSPDTQRVLRRFQELKRRK